jgi:hypothetical protein
VLEIGGRLTQGADQRAELALGVVVGGHCDVEVGHRLPAPVAGHGCRAGPVGQVLLVGDGVPVRPGRFLAAAAAAGCGLAPAPLLAGCGGPVGAARSKTLVLRLDVDMGNLDPALATGRSDYEIMECLYEGLRSYRPGQSDTVSTLVDEFQVAGWTGNKVLVETRYSFSRRLR